MLSIAGVGTAGGQSAGAAGNLGVVLLDTDAHIGQGAEVRAARDVQVLAHADEDALFVAAGVSVSNPQAPGVSLEGSLGAYVLDSRTHAYLNDGAAVDAGGNILVSARDDTDVDMAAGGLSFGTLGVGASLGLTVLTKDTQAYVGQNATVNPTRTSTPTTHQMLARRRSRRNRKVTITRPPGSS